MERRLEDLIRDGEGDDVSGKRKGKELLCVQRPRGSDTRRVNGGDVGTGLQWYTGRERSSESAHDLTNEWRRTVD